MTTKAADNRWGKVIWGQTKYGASSASDVIAWGLEVDWDQDRIFDGTNEASRMVGFNLFRGRRNMVRPTGLGAEPMEVGRLAVMLVNDDGRYDPKNTSSPLYPNVKPGAEVRFRVRDLSGAASPYPVFYGFVVDIIPVRDIDGSRKVQLLIEDGWSYLANLTAGFATLGDGAVLISSATTVRAILASVGWRWGEIAPTWTWAFFWGWGPQDRKAAQAIHDLTTALFSPSWITASGALRTHHYLDPHVSVLTITEDMLYKDIRATQPWVNKRNVVRAVAHPRIEAASGVIWSFSGAKPLIVNGGSIVVQTPYSYSGQACPARAVLQPVATTDWRTNTAADESGTDKTASCTAVLTDLGDRGLLRVTNNSGVDVYLSFAQVKGNAVYSGDPYNVTWPDDVVGLDNPREIVLDSIFNTLTGGGGVQGAPPDKSTLVYGVYSLISDPPPCVQVFMAGRPSTQFKLDLFDSVVADLPTIGLPSTGMWVGGIAMEARDEGCQDVLTTLYLEPYIIYP